MNPYSESFIKKKNSGFHQFDARKPSLRSKSNKPNVIHFEDPTNLQAGSFYGTNSPSAAAIEENMKKGFSTHSQFFGRSANNFNKNISNQNPHITGTSSQINLIENAN